MESSVVKDSLTTARDCKRYKTKREKRTSLGIRERQHVPFWNIWVMNYEEKLKLVTLCDRLGQVPVPTSHESYGYTEEEWSGLKKCQYWQKFNVG